MDDIKPIAVGDMIYVIDEDKTKYHGFICDIIRDTPNPFEGQKENEYVISLFQFNYEHQIVVLDSEYKTLWWRI